MYLFHKYTFHKKCRQQFFTNVDRQMTPVKLDYKAKCCVFFNTLSKKSLTSCLIRFAKKAPSNSTLSNRRLITHINRKYQMSPFSAILMTVLPLKRNKKKPFCLFDIFVWI